MSTAPILSIIIPTHNRSAMLANSLAALSAQSLPTSLFEVVVVADACHDDTEDVVTAYSAHSPYHLRLLSHAARHAAATRNLGATKAQGSILLFLDDDIIAQPGLVRAHMEAQNQNRVVLGYSKPILPAAASWWQSDARRWWEDTYREMRRKGHRFSYRDFFSGNASMPAALFHRVGGFDPSIAGRLEDYELGMRLLEAGARFCYVPQAIGHHHDNTDLAQWLLRLRQEGTAHIHIGQRCPELRSSLLEYVTEPHSLRRRLVRKLAFHYPRWGELLEHLLLRQARIYERLRLRGRWRRTVQLLREYNYLHGVSSAIGGQQAWAAWLQEAPAAPAVATDAPEVDMAHVPSAKVLQEMLEEATGKGLRLLLNEFEVFALPPQPGTEPLRVVHLDGALQQLAEQRFVAALALYLAHSVERGNTLCSASLPRSI